MLSSVLRSKRAVRVNVSIMRVFVKLRRWALSYDDLSKKLAELERKYDAQFAVVFKALKKMLVSPEKRRRIGFKKGKGKSED